ncbi:MAG: MGH1-like glycoside hydrolase domain-containing protein [Microthrixaceae bacterium]
MTAEAEGHEGDGGHSAETLPAASRTEIRGEARRILDAAWRTPGDGTGFCVPNPTTYPWQWLWDSCFHAVVWAHLGDERGLLEVRSALGAQDADGFVPHLRYAGGESPHAGLWGRADTSSITQPPMFGHAIGVLAEAGVDLPDEVLERATAGLRFLLERRKRSPGGLIEVCHPWESGCDDSPRWDSVLGGAWTPTRWHAAKGDLVASIERSPTGAPLANPAFAVASVGFNALVAWNARELVDVTGDRALAVAADEVVDALAVAWDAELATWIDDGPTRTGSGRVRTLDALLPALVLGTRDVAALLVDDGAYGAQCGPCGVHRAEPAFDPARYWRGPAWPQLTYLLWAAVSSDRSAAATAASPSSVEAVGEAVGSSLVRSMVTGTLRSRFAEYWEPDSGAALGAVPQSWTALSCVMVES